MLFSIGDHNQRHNTNANAAFSPLLAILFLVGLWQCLKHQYKRSAQLSPLYLLLLIWWFAMLIPAALTYEGQPHSLRSLGLVAPSVIIAAVGASRLLLSLGSVLKTSQKRSLAALLICITAITTCDVASDYFYRAKHYPGVTDAFNWRTYARAKDIVANTQTDKIVIIDEWANRHDYWPIQTILFLTDLKTEGNNLSYVRIQDLARQPNKDRAYIYAPHHLLDRTKQILRRHNGVEMY